MVINTSYSAIQFNNSPGISITEEDRKGNKSARRDDRKVVLDKEAEKLYNKNRVDTASKNRIEEILEERLRELAGEFTSILLKQMFSSMRNSVFKSDLLDGGFSEEVFTDMLDEEISKKGSTQQGFNNLGRILYEQLKKE